MSDLATNVDGAALAGALANRGVSIYPAQGGAEPLRQESAILLVEVSDRVFAFATGLGTRAIPLDMLEADFGLRAVLQSVDTGRLLELATSIPGSRGLKRSERLNQPGRAHRFTLSAYYSSLKRVVGEVTKKDKTVRLEAAEGVRVDWPTSKTDAVKTATWWLRRFNRNKPLPDELVDLCSIREVTSVATRNSYLSAIHSTLLSGAPSDLAIVPWLDDDVGDDGKYAFFYKPDPAKPAYVQVQLQTLDPQIWRTQMKAYLSDWDKFLTARAGLETQNASDCRRVIDWLSLTFKTPRGTEIALDSGRLFEVNATFLKRLEEDAKRICSHFAFPHSAYTYTFLKGQTEYDLNKDFCSKFDYDLLDEEEFRKIVGRSPVELCDAFNRNGICYVVKRLHTMDSVVKAVSQALDASEAIRSEATYWPWIVNKASLKPSSSAYDNPEAWRFVILLVTKKNTPLVDQLTFKGRLELRRFREQIGTYKHDYGVASVLEN